MGPSPGPSWPYLAANQGLRQLAEELWSYSCLSISVIFDVSRMTEPLESAGIDAADGPHYLRALTDMADRRTVVADAAIYTDNGIKLVEKGARIDSRLYDRLVQHKLREPIDRHLSIDMPVDGAALLAAAQALIEQDVLLGAMAQAVGAAARLLAPLRSVPLPGPMACKLTVMREQRPELFEHSLRMMTIAVFLGIKGGMTERDCIALAAAALLHDLGVLHMDPAWSDPDHKVVGPQRKHLVAHPITAMLMIRDAQVYPRATEVAVLEHHERMDGSGYPRGLAGADITPMGRVLLLAEVVAAFYEKYDDMPAQRLSLVLRLNHRKFPAALVASILPLSCPWAMTPRARSICWPRPLPIGISSRRPCPRARGPRWRAAPLLLPMPACWLCKRRFWRRARIRSNKANSWPTSRGTWWAWPKWLWWGGKRCGSCKAS
jgi:hypothetical protein